MSEIIEMRDIRNPVLTEVQREQLAAAEKVPFELSVDAVLSAAVERTGLDDFGPDDFKERLAVIIGSIDRHEHATALNRLALFGRCARLASTRLLAHDLLRRHPEIHELKIERPIIVAGLPRSGTTHLLNLMAADTRVESLKYWLALEPIPNPKEPALVDGVDPRYARAAEWWEQAKAGDPFMEFFHPMEPEHIHEDLELQMPDFSTYIWEFAFRGTEWRDYMGSHDQTPHYEYGKTMLKILDWQSGNKRRWVLKCPQHYEQLRPLMNVYPDATVVFTHRDPVASLQSIATMSAYRGRLWDTVQDPDWYLEFFADQIERLLRGYLRDVDLVPEAQRFDCMFDTFMQDDIAMVERIFDKAGLGNTPESRRQLEEYMATHQRGAGGRMVFNLRRDFGVDPVQLRERYAFYMDSLPVEIEAR